MFYYFMPLFQNETTHDRARRKSHEKIHPDPANALVRVGGRDI
jgi:hypothetical protein